MCKLAFGDISKCEISDIEIKRGGKSYTYLTLQELKSEDKELYLLVGTDMLLTLDLWKNSQMIFSLCTVCYVRRECDGKLSSEIEHKLELYRKNYGARILAIPSDAFEVSSTELRNKLSVGEDVTSYLNSAVFEYINERGLYS